jgi:hypothetical protein
MISLARGIASSHTSESNDLVGGHEIRFSDPDSKINEAYGAVDNKRI